MKTIFFLFLLFIAGEKCQGMYGAGGANLSDVWGPDFDLPPAAGSAKIEKAIEALDNLLLYQRFDRHLVEGDQRPAGQLPNFDEIPDGSIQIKILIAFFQGSDDEKAYAFERDILEPFANALTQVSSLTHMYPELEVLGRWGEEALWQGVEAIDLFKHIFKNTEELTDLRNFAELLRLSALAVEADDQEGKKITQESLRAILKDPTSMPTLLEKAHEGYFVEIRTHMNCIKDQVPDDTSTAGQRLSMIMALVQTGEIMKLAPSTYKQAPVVKELSQFRDKVLKIIPTKLEILEDAALQPSLAAVPPFLEEFVEWLDPSLNKPEPKTDVMDAIREALGYKKNWKSKAKNNPVPDPDEGFARTVIEKMKDLLANPSGVKSLAWDVVDISLSERLQGINEPLFQLQNIVDKAINKHPSDNEIINQWGDILTIIDIAPDEDIVPLLAKAQEVVQSYPERLVRNGQATQEQVNAVDWTPIRSFVTNDMDRIRTELHRKRMVASNPFSVPFQQRKSVQILSHDFYALNADQFMTLKLLGYSLVQAILEYPDVFASFNTYEDSITQIRKFWAHPRPATEFPEEVRSYSDDGKKNESLALASLYFMIQEKM
jgi:hypothetical protein